MSDLINTLRARREERFARDEELRTRLKEFGEFLRDATGEREIYGTSEQCTLEDIGPDEHYYGFLTFDGSLKIAYRSSEDDLSDAENGFDFTYTPKDLDKCDPPGRHR